MADGHAEGDVGAVQLIVLLAHLLLGGSADFQRPLVGLAQILHLVVGQQQLACTGSIGVGGQGQAEVCLHVGHGGLEGSLVGDVALHIGGVELGVRHLLVGEVGQEGVVVGGLVADGHAARLVVCGDEDEGVVGVGVVEVHSGLHGVAHLQHIVDGSGGIVGVAGPVNLAGLGHQEEALLIVQQLDALPDVVGQLPLACGGVHGVVHGLAVGQSLRDDEGLACTGFEGGSVCLTGDDVVAVLGSDLVVVGAGAVAVHLLELTACEVFEAGVGQLFADGVVVLAGLLVCVEGSRGGVVDVDGGDDAHLVVLLGMELLGDGLIGHIAGPWTHIDDAALGLMAGGDGGSSGSGVGAEGGAVIGGHAAHLGKLGEAQLAFSDGAVVLHRALVEAGRLDLGRAHAVADEEEDIFGLAAEDAQQAVLLLCCLVHVGCSGMGGCGSSSQHTGGRRKSTSLQKAAAGHFILFHT